MSPFPGNNDDDDDMDPLEKAGNWASRFFGAAAKASIRAGSEEEKKFFRAVEANKIPDMLACLDAGIDPNVFTKEGLTALHIAARRNLPDMAAALINRGADPRRAKQDEPDYLPLNEALKFDRPEIIRFLASNGGVSLAPDQFGWTVLHHAVHTGKKDVVRAFLDAGVDGNTPTQNGTTPLLIAILHNQGDIIKILLDDAEVASGICKHYAATNEQKRTAFHWAVTMGKGPVVKDMIGLGASVNTADATGLTPLCLAIDSAYTEIVRNLLKAGADINKAEAGQTLPLHFTAKSEDISTATERIFDLLLKAGADPCLPDAATGRSALHFAAANAEAPSLVKKLLALPVSSASLNGRDLEGASPLHLAAAHLDTESLKLLMAAGADINRRHGDDAATPLIAAARANNTAAIRILLTAGAHARLADTGDKSALFYAREHKNAGMISVLEEYVQKELKFKQKPPSSGKTP